MSELTEKLHDMPIGKLREIYSSAYSLCEQLRVSRKHPKRLQETYELLKACEEEAEIRGEGL